MIRLLRKWRNTSAPIALITSTAASTYVQGLVKKGQFAVFQLPNGRAFAQMMRIETGGLRIEVSARSDRLEKLLEPVGTVSANDLGFLTVVSQPGADDIYWAGDRSIPGGAGGGLWMRQHYPRSNGSPIMNFAKRFRRAFHSSPGERGRCWMRPALSNRRSSPGSHEADPGSFDGKQPVRVTKTMAHQTQRVRPWVFAGTLVTAAHA